MNGADEQGCFVGRPSSHIYECLTADPCKVGCVLTSARAVQEKIISTSLDSGKAMHNIVVAVQLQQQKLQCPS